MPYVKLPLPLRAAQVPEDLGVVASSARRRRHGSTQRKFAKAYARAKGVRKLVGKRPRAHVLQTTGVQPTECHGNSSIGITPSRRPARRTLVLHCTPLCKARACQRTTSKWHGRHGIPVMEGTVMQISKWLQLWEHVSPDQRDL